MSVWRKVGPFAADLIRLGGRYVGDPRSRRALRDALSTDGLTPRSRRTAAAEAGRAIPAALRFEGLAPTSLSLAGIAILPHAAPHLNILLPEIGIDGAFAGIRTALHVARILSESLGLPLRVIELNFAAPGRTPGESTRHLARTFGLTEIEVVPREQLGRASFTATDVWLATHWTTAHAAQVACETGVLAAERVVYLIQDYEPGFVAASDSSVTAAATYHAGFTALVNSVPLWRHLCAEERLDISDELVFSPDFDNEDLAATASARRVSEIVTVLFYARPSKPRNLFHLGIAALRTTVAEFGEEGTTVRYLSMGERHADTDLGGGARLVSLGRLSRENYFAQLSEASVLLSLQQSAHPSHPPFDAAISGGLAVTNDFGGNRGALHPRISAAPTEVNALGAQLARAIRASVDGRPGTYLPVEAGLLGRPLEEAIAAVAARLSPDLAG
jgi:hypothetical protein